MIKRNIETDIELSAEELAFLFTEMLAEDQAKFFNEVGRLSNEWDAPFVFQLQAISDDPALNGDGRYVMSKIGEYSKRNG